MEAIREICTIKQGNLVLQLPQQFWNCEVEVIVLPLQNTEEKPLWSIASIRKTRLHFSRKISMANSGER